VIGILRKFSDEKFHKHTSDNNYSDWMFTYSKDRASACHAVCCGEFADSPDVAVVKNAAVTAATDHLTHAVDGHLCFVYWQLTARLKKQLAGEGSIKTNTTGPTGTHQATDNLMTDLNALLPAPSRRSVGNRFVATNVISHDFVTPDTCQQIVKYNKPPKIKAPWPNNW
jgi:hypothetical protein